ncbi:hypothetical protein [Acinetobacter brisouii]
MLEQQMNTTHYYKANNFEEMGNYSQALAEYEAYLTYPNRSAYLDELATIGQTLMKAKIDTANATAYVNEAESLLNKMSDTNAKYLVMKVNDAKYDLGIKDEQMLRSYIDAFEYVKNTSADAYNRPIELATLLGQKKVANEMAKRQQDMRTVDAKAKAMNIPGRFTSRDTSEKTLLTDAFYHGEFKKLRNSFFTNYYAKMLESDMKIQEINANMARMNADLERRNAEYEARKSSSNNASVSGLIGVVAGAIVSVKTGDSTLLNQAVQEANGSSSAAIPHSSSGISVSDSSITSSNTLTKNYEVTKALNYCISVQPYNSRNVKLINNCGQKVDIHWFMGGDDCPTGRGNGCLLYIEAGSYQTQMTANANGKMLFSACPMGYYPYKPNIQSTLEHRSTWAGEGPFICAKNLR